MLFCPALSDGFLFSARESLPCSCGPVSELLLVLVLVWAGDADCELVDICAIDVLAVYSRCAC